MVGLKIGEKNLILGTVVREDSIYSHIIIIMFAWDLKIMLVSSK